MKEIIKIYFIEMTLLFDRKIIPNSSGRGEAKKNNPAKATKNLFFKSVNLLTSLTKIGSEQKAFTSSFNFKVLKILSMDISAKAAKVPPKKARYTEEYFPDNNKKVPVPILPVKE